ncbi:hypothetical protein [Sphingomonas sp.]|uniref:hypothetical protein n=1 Tax=Sphingomonas sp. TaxID=28214 RepID=UPI003AFF7764
MRRVVLPVFLACLSLAACNKGNAQADALDNAATQADPAAADVMRNEADAIRENGSDANLSAAGSPVQDAMANAGNAAERSNAAPGATQAPVKTADTQARPHKAGDQVPPPQQH